jgi:uncharacterized lipoprotein NlpE involved in copper resistance
MNKKFIIIMAVIIGLGSCLSKTIDWAGLYTGTIPAADGEGINVSVKLNKNNTYELTYEYIGKPDNTFTLTGSFKWNDTKDIINLEIANTPSYYKIAEKKLIQLDMEGKPITGNLADMYVLNKR